MSMKTFLATTGHGLVRASRSESEEWTLALLLTGLPELYRAQAKQIGILGLVGVVLLWVGMLLFLLVLSGLQILDVAVPGSIPHPRGDGAPLAIIPALLGGVLIVIVGIRIIRAHVFTAVIGWVILIASVLLLPIHVASVNGVLGNILTNSAAALLYGGLAWVGASLSFQVPATQVS